MRARDEGTPLHRGSGSDTGPAPGVHPLLPLLLNAARGDVPPVDGRAVLVPPLPGGLQAVVSFTGHAVLATHLAEHDLRDLHLDGFGAALHPEVLRRLAARGGTVGVLDLTLVARGTGGGGLPVLLDQDDHPRARHARSLRQRVAVHGDERGVVTMSQGLAGRTELSIEARTPGRGEGGSLLADALRLAPAGEPVFAAVSPGNVRSLRAFLDTGFRPVASEVIIGPAAPGGA